MSPTASPAAALPPAHRHVRAFRGLLAVCCAASLLLSHRLWRSDREYPLAPVLDALPAIPPPIDLVLFVGMLAALAAAAVLPRPVWALRAVLAIGLLWAVLDQNRWQPYLAFYLVGVLCLLIASRAGRQASADGPGAWALAPLQLFVVAMYAYSGLHKLNAHYVRTDFGWIAGPALEAVGIDPAVLPAGAVTALALFSGVAEAALGVMLLFPRTRRVAVVGLTLMHAVILLSIGPLGRDFNRVVWPWNVAAVGVLWLLFWPAATGARLDGFVRAWGERWPGGKATRGRRETETVPRPVLAAWYGVLVLFCVLPALSWAGRWDASLSFQMYAGKQPLAWLFFDDAQRGRIAPSAARSVEVPGQVDVMRWAMDDLGSPPVLEDRVLRRVGRDFARRAGAGPVRLLVAGPPGAVDGKRDGRLYLFSPPAWEAVDASAGQTFTFPEGL